MKKINKSLRDDISRSRCSRLVKGCDVGSKVCGMANTGFDGIATVIFSAAQAKVSVLHRYLCFALYGPTKKIV